MTRLAARTRASQGWRADLIALAAGAVSALALPPVYLLPALLIGIPTLLHVIEGARSAAVAGRRGWWFGFGMHLIGDL